MCCDLFALILSSKCKEIKVIYVHSDGYPDGVGDVLLKHYNDYDSASMLVNRGSASYIAETLDECNFYETKEDSFIKKNLSFIFNTLVISSRSF